jgi:hypothetical protein
VNTRASVIWTWTRHHAKRQAKFRSHFRGSYQVKWRGVWLRRFLQFRDRAEINVALVHRLARIGVVPQIVVVQHEKSPLVVAVLLQLIPNGVSLVIVTQTATLTQGGRCMPRDIPMKPGRWYCWRVVTQAKRPPIRGPRKQVQPEHPPIFQVYGQKFPFCRNPLLWGHFSASNQRNPRVGQRGQTHLARFFPHPPGNSSATPYDLVYQACLTGPLRTERRGNAGDSEENPHGKTVTKRCPQREQAENHAVCFCNSPALREKRRSDETKHKQRRVLPKWGRSHLHYMVSIFT